MMVYVAVLTYVVEGHEKFPHTVVAGIFRMRDTAERTLNREYEFIESDPSLTVTEMLISEQWLD